MALPVVDQLIVQCWTNFTCKCLQERQEIIELKKVKMNLLKHIDGMKEQDTSLKAQVAKLQQQLAVEYKRCAYKLAACKICSLMNQRGPYNLG